LDLSLALPYLIARLNDLVVQALMVSFVQVVMVDVLAN
jgi:hypothetical protein